MSVRGFLDIQASKQQALLMHAHVTTIGAVVALKRCMHSTLPFNFELKHCNRGTVLATFTRQ